MKNSWTRTAIALCAAAALAPAAWAQGSQTIEKMKQFRVATTDLNLPTVPQGGANAAAIALGMGADVTIIERSTERMEELVARFGIQAKTLYSTQGAIEDECATADLVIGGVLIPGAAAPKLLTRKMLKDWKPGSVFVDVAIDQGGCAETSKATTHANPTYDVVHYCVANMPGGVARTSTFALNNVTLPFAMAIANKGWKKALADDVHLKNGLNVAHGKVTYKAVADDLGYEYVPADKVIAA